MCLPKTRQGLLDDIVGWVNNPNEGSVFWLYGAPGSGKSTVANTIGSLFFNFKRLAASFRFSRDTNQRNEPTFLLGNLTFQLAHFDARLKKEIISIINAQGNMDSLPLQNQLRTFIVDVLRVVEFTGPVVLVIDALDESGRDNVRDDLLQALSAELPSLPSFVKILITSRNESDIRSRLAGIPSLRSHSIDNTQGTREDILTFIDYQMSQIRRSHRNLPLTWPEDEKIDSLTHQAAGLFIWASVACKYIKDGDPKVRLHHVLSDDGSRRERAETWGLDNLYLGILRRCCGTISPDVFKYIVGSILFAKTPLSQTGLDSFLGLGDRLIEQPMLLPNGSKVQLTDSTSILDLITSILQVGETIRFVHPSLFDFFTTAHRCDDSRFYINSSNQNHILTDRCFRVMSELLRRDICDINDPTKLNSDVLDLDDRLREHVPEHLRYACQFWSLHLADIPFGDKEIYNKATEFLFEHFLHWLEVMSLLEKVDSVFNILQQTKHWFDVRHHPFHFILLEFIFAQHSSHSPASDVRELLDDSIDFVQYFDPAIRASAAHIYVSGIAFTPAETVLSKNYSSKVGCIPKVRIGVDPFWSPTRYERRSFFGSACAISPDGSRFVFADTTTVARLWDVTTGHAIGAPLATRGLSSASFSRDGSKIVTSSGNIIYLWDGREGGPIGGPFTSLNDDSLDEFSAMVDDVEISVDGTHIFCAMRPHVFSSRRAPVEPSFRILEVKTGADSTHLCTTPNPGQSVIRHLKSSENGSKIVCIFEDGTAHIFEVSCGTLIRVSTLEGRIENAGSAVFTPDATRLLAVSSSRAIEFWDALTGAALKIAEAGLHINCGRGYYHVPFAFSPDGTRFCASSGDSLYIWSASTGNVMLGPLTGHTSEITVAIFSHDGNKVLSGSHDRTVRMWDAHSGTPIGVPFVGHTNEITSIISSSDGARIVSSTYKQFRLWDVSRGTCLGTVNGWHRMTAFVNDGQQIIFSDGHSVRLWDPARAKDCRLISSVTVFPTCSRLVCASDDSTLQIWDVTSGTPVCDSLRGHADQITSTAFSADGTRVASASGDGKIILWDAVRGQIIGGPLEGHTAVVTSVAFSPTGDQVVSASEDNTIRIWDVTSAKALLTIHVAYVQSIAFSPDGTRIVCVHDNLEVQILDPSLCTTTNILSHSIQWMLPKWCAFLHGNEQIVFISQDGRRHLRDIATGITTGISVTENVHHICAGAFSSDAEQFVFISKNSDIQISDVATGTAIGPPLKHAGTIQFLAISPDSERIASLSDSSRIRVWDATNGTLIASAIEGTRFDSKLIAFSPDGKQIVRADNEGNIHVWDYITGLVVPYRPTKSEYVPLASVSFSSDGTQIICVLEDNRIRTWNYLSSTVVDESMPQEDYPSPATATRDMSVFSDAYFPNGTRIASIRRSQTICITNTATGDLKHLLLEGIDVTIKLPTFSPDGMMVGCVIVPDTIHIWDARTGIAIGKPVKVPTSKITSITFSLDGTKLAYTSESIDKVTLSINIWDIARAVSVRELQRPMDSVRSFFCFPDFTGIVVTHQQGGDMEIWNVVEGSMVGSIQGGSDPILSVVISPDGSRMVVIPLKGGKIRLCDVPRRTVVKVFPAPQMLSRTRSSAVFSQDGHMFAYEHSCHGCISDAATGAVIGDPFYTYIPEGYTIFSPDLSRMFSFRNYMEHFAFWDFNCGDRSAQDAHRFTPQRTMMTLGYVWDRTDRDGWFLGETGERLFWVPSNERGVWCTMPGRVVLGHDTGKLVIVDMEDYLNLPPVRRAWRDRFLCYTEDSGDVQLAAVLRVMSN